MRGRALLATVAGATVTLPGCFGDGPHDSGSPTTPTRPTTDDRAPTDSSADDATSSATPAGDPDVTVESVVLQHGYATPTSPDSIVVTDADQAYLVVDVAVDGSLAREDLVLEIPDRTYTPETDLRLYRTEWGSETDYADGRDRGLVVFAPGLAGEGVDVRIAWPGGARSVEGDVRESLGRPAPTMSAALAMVTEHEGTEAPPVEIEVTNESDRQGRFLGALNRVGPRVAYAPIARVSGPFDAGETRTLTVEDSWSGLPEGALGTVRR
jgi:hypothetical protein